MKAKLVESENINAVENRLVKEKESLVLRNQKLNRDLAIKTDTKSTKKSMEKIPSESKKKSKTSISPAERNMHHLVRTVPTPGVINKEIYRGSNKCSKLSNQQPNHKNILKYVCDEEMSPKLIASSSANSIRTKSLNSTIPGTSNQL